MRRSRTLLSSGLVAAVLIAGCAARHSRDDLGAKDSVLPNSVPNYSVPLDLREFEVDSTEGGARGVFLKLSRLPSAVSSTSQSDPARIIVDIQGPTGTESPEEVFPGGDLLVTHVAVTRQAGGLRVVIDLALDDPPDFAVLPMADWVLVRIDPPNPRKRPWAHGA
jgi:hypothetical protein